MFNRKLKQRISQLEYDLQRERDNLKAIIASGKQTPFAVGDEFIWSAWDDPRKTRLLIIERVIKVEGFAANQYHYLTIDQVSGDKIFIVHSALQKGLQVAQ